MRPPTRKPRRTALLCAVSAIAFTCFAPRLEAQKIYRWTDERGVVHFGHMPPQDGSAEERHLPPPKPRATAAPAAEESTPAAAERAPARPEPAKAAPQEQESKAAPDVLLDKSESSLVGATVQRFSGTVKNQGKTLARDVSVNIRVVGGDGRQECLHKKIAVSPPDLGPGATGSYAVELDHPCFGGGTDAFVEASWH